MKLNRREFLKGSIFSVLTGVFLSIQSNETHTQLETLPELPGAIPSLRPSWSITEPVISINDVIWPNCDGETVTTYLDVLGNLEVEIGLWSPLNDVPANIIAMPIGSYCNIEIKYSKKRVHCTKGRLVKQSITAGIFNLRFIASQFSLGGWIDYS